MIDLNTLVAPGSGLQLLIAHSINDRGEIAGDGILANGDSHAFLLIPCDENQTGAQGCENNGTSAMTQSEAASVAHNATTLTQGSPSSSDAMAAIRSRLTHRYPYRGFGTYQTK
jgi:hypothetical protein